MKKQKVQAIDIAKMLIANGWKPNKEYTNLELNENGFVVWRYDGRITLGSGLLIDKDNRYAVTLKDRVMTIHDSKRSFCKIMSMQYCEIELKIDRLICDRIIFVA